MSLNCRFEVPLSQRTQKRQQSEGFGFGTSGVRSDLHLLSMELFQLQRHCWKCPLLSDQLILKERTGHRSLEALHKYKRTGSDQQCQVSMALLPQFPKREPEKENIEPETEDNDDFKPLKKRPKMDPMDIKAGMFPSSSVSHCTFNINFTVPK